MVTEGGFERVGHERGITGAFQQMRQADVEILAPGVLHDQTHPDARAKRQEFVASQLIGQAPIAGKDDAEQSTGIELSGGEQSQLA